ncbi:MAG: hypothetical protein Kow0047_10110 [Anaerolineae bacterium]
MDIPFLIILLAVIFILLRLEFIFYLIYVLLGAWMVSRWWPRRALRQIQVERLYDDHAFLGDQVRVILRIHNRSRIPVAWLRVSESVPLTLHVPNYVRRVVAVPGRRHVDISYTLDCRKRGYYPLGPTLLQAGDLFGFGESYGQAAEGDHITVYPQIIPLSRLGIESDLPYGTVRTRRRLHEDPARMVGLRQYEPGDPLHRLHWKASAHAGELLVTKLEAAIALETMIALDLRQSDYDAQEVLMASEWAIVVAASIAHHLAQQRQAVGLMTNGVDPIAPDGAAPHLSPRPGKGHVMKVLEVLARVGLSDDGPPFDAWLIRETTSLAWGTTVVVIAPKGDEALCQALHRLVRRGLNPLLITVQPSLEFRRVRQRARMLGFPAYQVVRERDLTTQWARPQTFTTALR